MFEKVGSYESEGYFHYLHANMYGEGGEKPPVLTLAFDVLQSKFGMITLWGKNFGAFILYILSA